MFLGESSPSCAVEHAERDERRRRIRQSTVDQSRVVGFDVLHKVWVRCGLVVGVTSNALRAVKKHSSSNRLPSTRKSKTLVARGRVCSAHDAT